MTCQWQRRGTTASTAGLFHEVETAESSSEELLKSGSTNPLLQPIYDENGFSFERNLFPKPDDMNIDWIHSPYLCITL